MAAMTRASFLALNDMRVRRMAVPEWNTEVFLRRFSVADHKVIAQASPKELSDIDSGVDFNMKVVLLAVSDEQGEPILTEAEVPLLMARDSLVVRRLVREALIFNQMRKREEDEPEPMEELEKNSQGTTPSASPSG